jgi:hypothetical protein
MGDADTALVGGMTAFTWRTQTRTSIDLDALRWLPGAQYLPRKSTEARVLLPKALKPPKPPKEIR